ncbi:nucleoside phosphorylase [soil metagenome]
MTAGPAHRPAWYLRVGVDDIGDGVVLVGDRGRARLSADLLDDARIINEDRGLTTVTGMWRGRPLTVVAFGMGAPIATICLHELVALGASRFVRAGTIMALGATRLGDTVVSTRALIHEGTSSTYGVTESASEADRGLLAQATRSFGDDDTVRIGVTASCDGFYTQMSDLLGTTAVTEGLRAVWQDAGVIGVDMETSALYSAARTLGVAALSVCLASVDLATNEMMELPARQLRERELMITAFGLLDEENQR